jgi:hypothetical protein
MQEDAGSMLRRFGSRVKNAIISRAYRAAPQSARRWWDAYANDLRISRSPDREVLRASIFPKLTELIASEEAPRVLWVGCARFTKDYYSALESKGAQCWTMDVDPKVRRWGRRGRHLTGDLRSVAMLFPKQYFDVLFCNGVFGFGIDSIEAQISAIEAMATITRPGGWMLLGWNTNKVIDPLASGIVTPWFEPAELPGFGTRQFVDRCTHVYDFFQLRERYRNPL